MPNTKDNAAKRFLNIQQELKAPKNQINKSMRYKFRSCEDILEAAKKVLKDNEMFIIINDEVETRNSEYKIENTNQRTNQTTIKYSDTKVYIKATATVYDIHSDWKMSASAYAREALEQIGLQEPQVTGSTSSYARKYALNGLFAIDDTKDDDYTNTQGKDNKTTNKSEIKQPEPKNEKPKEILEIQKSLKENWANIPEEGKEKIKVLTKKDGSIQDWKSLQEETLELIKRPLKKEFLDLYSNLTDQEQDDFANLDITPNDYAVCKTNDDLKKLINNIKQFKKG
jgi:hypothetical protein